MGRGEGKKKKKNKEESLPWCWYCEREFVDEAVLVQHQRTKHYKCHICHKKMNSGSGLAIHVLNVHKEEIKAVPNAIKGREGTDLVIFGMEGIPEEYLDAWQGGKGPAGTGSDSEGESAKRQRVDAGGASFNVGPFGTMRPPWMPGGPAAPPSAPFGPPSFSPALMRPVYPSMPMPMPPMPMPMGMPPGMMAPPPPMPPYPGMPGYPPPFPPGAPGYPAPPPGWPGAPWGMPMPPMPPMQGPPGTSAVPPPMPTPALPAAAASDAATAAAAAAAAVVAAAAGAAPPSAALAVAAAAVAATVAPPVPVPAPAPAPEPTPAPPASAGERLVYDDSYLSMEERRAMLDRYRWVPPAL